jgi:hypothetical protein
VVEPNATVAAKIAKHAFCLQRRNLRRTMQIALVVGVVLTAINQGG